MSNFKVGDKVYYPSKSQKVHTLKASERPDYPLWIDFKDVEVVNAAYQTFTCDGKFFEVNKAPDIVHATPENHALLEKLYGVKFEKPATPPSSREIIRAMHKSGIAYVPCWVSDSDEHPTRENVWVFVQFANDEFYLDDDGVRWKYATPFDPRTGEPITEMPE